MHARGSTLEGSPEKIDDVARHVQERALPRLRQMDGFEGFLALGDRHSGKMIGVSFWESEERLRASEVETSGVRSEAADAAGGMVGGVEHYEVFAFEAPSEGPLGAVTDTVGGVTGTVGGATESVRG